MIKKGFKYVCQFCLLLFISIGLLSFSKPQKISANQSLSTPFLGINFNVIDIERSIRYTSIKFDIQSQYNGNNTNLSQMRCTSWDSQGRGCLIYSNQSAEGYYFTTDINSNTLSYSATMDYVYEYDILLDNYYVGWVEINLNQNSNTKTKYYVNGTSINIQSTYLQLGTFTISNYELVKYDYNSIPQNITDIENYLKSIDLSTDELEDIVRGIRNINQQILNKNNWNFPFESFSLANYLFNQNYSQIGITTLNNFEFPIFSLNSNDKIYSFYRGGSSEWRMKVRFRINKRCDNLTYFNNLFSYPSNVTIENIQAFNAGTSGNTATSSNLESILMFDYVCTSSGSDYYLSVKQNSEIMPIYFQRDNYKFISTDFALRFNLRNEILDNLDIIANGNNQSNNSTNLADNTNQELQSATTQEEQLVNNAESDMQNKLDDLNIQNQNNNLFGNSKFVGSANWVKQQFDYFTNNNAYGYLITFSLVIGISLVIIGKLRG